MLNSDLNENKNAPIYNLPEATVVSVQQQQQQQQQPLVTHYPPQQGIMRRSSEGGVRGDGRWAHTSCCELHRGDDCCGCIDNGACYIVKHACCLPCSFGTISEKISDGEYSRLCCGLGITAGFVIGAGLFGGPMLPCAVRVRRRAVEKYGIKENFCESLARICLCPGASLIQMLMEAEEEEHGDVGLCGCWKEDKTPRPVEGAVYMRMVR
jgi:Cys-rich protein (TIGR01571 family)